MIGRFTVWLLVLAGLVAVGFKTPARPYLDRVVGWAQEIVKGEDPSYTVDTLEVDIVDRINYARMPNKSPLITVDSELETWLRAIANTINTDDLKGLVSRIQTRFPRYLEVSVTTNRSARLRDMAAMFDDFSYQSEAQVNNLAVAVRKLPASRGYEAIIVSGQRLDDFSPEALTSKKAFKQSSFFAVCTHCQYPHACTISPGQRGVILECPKCNRVFGVLASDDEGHFRYVNEYLTGYAPPHTFEEEGEKLHQLYTIWNAVVNDCTYQTDATELNPSRDSWQTALETITLGHGDCEDSSILLADWLIQRGFQVRVALGRYGDLGQHAWCVVKLEGVDYLLESTEGPPNPSKPPYVSDVGSRYVPETLFDRDALYVRAKPGSRFDGDYWSSKNWIRVQPRRMFDSLVKNDNKAAFTKLAETNKAQQPLVTATKADPKFAGDAKLGHLLKLRAIPQDTKFWSVPTPNPSLKK